MITTQTIQERLEQLNAEVEKGQQILRNLEAQRIAVTQTLLSIGGAQQVLRELLPAETVAPSEPADATAEPSTTPAN